MVARDGSSGGALPVRKRWGPVFARPAWLQRIERAMRPLDYLPRRVALGAGVAVGAAVGFPLGWSGAPWTLGAGLLFAGGAWWLVKSAEPVAVLARSAKPQPPPPEPAEPDPVELPVEPASPAEPVSPPVVDPLAMVDLQGGRFWMGSEKEDKRAFSDEHPRHEVEVAPFSMMTYVVTQKLYREVTGNDPGSPKGDDLPANNVSWYDAIEFCNRLSDQKGLARAYLTGDNRVTRVPEADGYRLPTEAEWEYACRAGTTTSYSFGNDEKKLGEFAWYGDFGGDVKPVGRKKPNPWGLYDMHGNVWEWCWDPRVDYPYVGPEMTLPAGGFRVVRGGSFGFDPRFLRSADRRRRAPEDRLRRIGFRCVRGPRRQP